ncbi:MAG: hypothetical protein RL434_1819 [Pseudomonadota bacterium]|jgi:benzoate/toluate 1,2-dioxygenase alpha subunit/2,4,5-trichlorophenoxyacetic acid oxygenase 1
MAMTEPAELASLLDDRPEAGAFRVLPEAFTDATLFDLEMTHIFESTWVFVGLESEVAKPHDFVTTRVGRVPVLLTRDGDGTLKAFLNSCRHRGTLLCPLRRGNQRVHVCHYHGWAYDSGGRNTALTWQADGQYPAAFGVDDHNLVPVARVASYRGFIFVSLSAAVSSLEEHLGEARVFLDLVADQAPQGLEFVPGGVSYTFDGNWKLQFENGLDYYHFVSTHVSFIQILRQRAAQEAEQGLTPQWGREFTETEPEAEGTFSFPHGHAVTWSVGIAGQGAERRPLPRDPARLAELRQKLGDTRLKWMLRQRNLTLFPNLQIVDIQSLQLRLWQPLSVDRTRMVSWCLAPIGENAEARRYRIRQYEEFFNPSGLATSDDNVMYAYCQEGYVAGTRNRIRNQGHLRGMGQGLTPPRDHAAELGLKSATAAYGTAQFGDETCIQAGYREWMRLLLKGVS